MSQIKKAALFLKNLAEEDRAWFVDKMKSDELNNHESILTELELLDTVKLSDTLSEHLSNFIVKETVDLEVLIAIDSTKLTTIVNILELEPDWIKAQLLSAHSWTWRKKYFKKIGAFKRKAIYKELTSNSFYLSEKIQRELINGLYNEIIKKL